LATDTWDTIEWLVKNIPESNGRVGILGISYDGFLPPMALVNPHPALKVSVPMNPMVERASDSGGRCRRIRATMRSGAVRRSIRS
jgi:predicted acyl esterase